MESPMHRVFVTPELVTLIFLHLDHGQSAFATTCKMFHTVATSPAVIYNWHNKRYWPYEILSELAYRHKCLKKEIVDVFLARGARCSRALIGELLAMAQRTRPELWDGEAESLPQSAKRTFALCLMDKHPHLYRLDEVNGWRVGGDDRSVFDLAQLIYHLAPVGIQMPWQDPVNGGHKLSPQKDAVQAHFDKYGLPAWRTKNLAQLVLVILVIGKDLDWWDETLQKYAGVPSMLIEPIMVYVVNIIKDGSHVKEGLLRWLPFHHFANTGWASPEVAQRLLQAGHTTFWRSLSRLITSQYPEHPTPATAIATSLANPIDNLYNFMVNAGAKTSFMHFIAHLILYHPKIFECKAGQLRSRVFTLFNKYLRNDFMDLPSTMRSEIAGLLLLHLACHPCFHSLDQAQLHSRLASILQTDSLACQYAFAWPTKSIMDLQRLTGFLARYLPPSQDLSVVVLAGAKLMMQRRDMGAQLLSLAATCDWLPKAIEISSAHNSTATGAPYQGLDRADPAQAVIAENVAMVYNSEKRWQNVKSRKSRQNARMFGAGDALMMPEVINKCVPMDVALASILRTSRSTFLPEVTNTEGE